MSTVFAKLSFTAVTGLLGTYVVGKKIEKDYPPTEGLQFEVGKKYNIEGEELVFVGCTGHGKNTVLDFERGLYYGPKDVAQCYAQINRDGDGGVVHFIFAKTQPGLKDFGPQRFEGPHAPISKEGWKSIGGKVLYTEEVNENNRLGMAAAFKRMLQEKNKK